jgi:5'-nucleotidase
MRLAAEVGSGAFSFRRSASAALRALLVVAVAVSGFALPRLRAADRITLSIVGTTDLHGNIFPRGGRGGLTVLAGYVNNLRAVRAADGGAVLLVDSGDTYQGGIESNLSEGRLVIDAYNAMGYTAAAIGNHEFDFGGVDVGGRQQSLRGDSRGALKAIAARARFPYLAANLIDAGTGRPVDWPNVRPSAIVEAAGIKVGLIGVMTVDALRSTLIVNTHGLRVAPLAETIISEAEKLRAAGATVIVVVAHAGGRCARLDDPGDLSSCEASSEIFQVAGRLPPRLVDVIMAGHTHAAVAHQAAGIAVTQAFSGGRAFGRIDVAVDRQTKRVTKARIFPPRDLCLEEDPAAQGCDPAVPPAAGRVAVRYEGRPVVADAAIDMAMAPELQRVRALRATPLGATVDTPFRRAGDFESPLGNLFADAMRESVPEADVAIGYNLAAGGLRADLIDGPLTFGSLYDVFPFDNRLVHVSLTGAELHQVFVEEILRDRRGALALSGIRVSAACTGRGLEVDLHRASGAPIGPHDRLEIATTDFLASGALFSPITLSRGYVVPVAAPIVREAVETWLRRRGGRLHQSQFVDPSHPRLQYPSPLPAQCASQ